MSEGFVPFDAIWTRIVAAVESAGAIPERAGPVYLVRNLHGQIRVSVSEEVEGDASCRGALGRLAAHLRDVLGAHGPSESGGILFVPPSLLASAHETAREVRPGVCLVDRLVTGGGWWTVEGRDASSGVRRCALFSVKGGVGRSTTAVILAQYLAAQGERVLVVDLDLESPGLSSGLLDAAGCPAFGVTDWFVEDLVGQGEHVLGEMAATPAWAHDLEGEVRVVPAHGRDPGEYLAKLGRVYMDSGRPWTARLQYLLSDLEGHHAPTIVIMESRSGLHDIAAATVTDLDAQVLLFATDSDSTWTDYGILFRHWERYWSGVRNPGAPVDRIRVDARDRLSTVPATVPRTFVGPLSHRVRRRAFGWRSRRGVLIRPA